MGSLLLVSHLEALERSTLIWRKNVRLYPYLAFVRNNEIVCGEIGVEKPGKQLVQIPCFFFKDNDVFCNCIVTPDDTASLVR